MSYDQIIQYGIKVMGSEKSLISFINSKINRGQINLDRLKSKDEKELLELKYLLDQLNYNHPS